MTDMIDTTDTVDAIDTVNIAILQTNIDQNRESNPGSLVKRTSTLTN